MPTPRLLLLPVLLLLALAAAAPAGASTTQESMFQDDPLLVYGTETTGALPTGQSFSAAQETVQKRTLDKLKRLGVDRIRVSVFWALVAPANASRTKPAFNAADPGQYDPEAWTRYDKLLVNAANRGIAVNMNITSPVPRWAAGNPEREDLVGTYEPDPVEFAHFVTAVGTRYSGTYRPVAGGPALPRADYWSIWNEPNQPGWLTPQWVPDRSAPGGFAEAAPRIYRALADAMWSGLQVSGHGGDTILVGEMAPKGQVTARGISRAMKPRRFILRVYCLDDNAVPLRGADATRNGCPTDGPVEAFRDAHPGLFKVTGLAHHPYEVSQRPDAPPLDPEFFTTANLRALGSLMGRIFARYGAPVPGKLPGSFPLYLTEYGYQTSPPDPLGVTLAQQAAYLNQAEYLTARNRAVKTLSQFLLIDDRPVAGKTAAARFGATFQSGLQTLQGRRKPAYAAYRFPLHVVRSGRDAKVWGLLRVGRPNTRETVRIEGLARGAKRYRLLRTVRTEPRRGYLEAAVRLTRTTRVRLAWTDPATKAVVRSRSAVIGVR